ncbi:hypothetical protein [Halorussus salinisoli]|uniref:hypothetical protein n=1 Tax=Halorussus salinisoli TaxID=2558242 RepID=UPI001484EA53
MANRANPAFAAGVVAVPLVALVYAVTVGPLQHLNYVHVMAGVLWTGIDLFLGLVLGPVVGGLDTEKKAAVFRRLTPKTTFLMPSLATVTIFGGVTLAQDLGKFPHADPWIALMSTAIALPVVLLVAAQFDALTDRRTLGVFGVVGVGHAAWLARTLPEFAMTSHEIAAALGIVTMLSILGFGVLLPGELRMYREMTSANPDEELIGAIGMRNAKLAGVQGTLQLAIIFVMVYVRF